MSIPRCKSRFQFKKLLLAIIHVQLCVQQLMCTGYFSEFFLSIATLFGICLAEGYGKIERYIQLIDLCTTLFKVYKFFFMYKCVFFFLLNLLFKPNKLMKTRTPKLTQFFFPFLIFILFFCFDK